MADVHSKEVRSYNMSRIKGKDTEPELLVRKFLFSKGLRYRLYNKKLPGKPDIILAKYRTVVLIHGCFWHGHLNCPYFVLPKSRTEWWTQKIEGNVKRDSEVSEKLCAQGWKIILVWECELKPKNRQETLSKLFSKLTGSKN